MFFRRLAAGSGGWLGVATLYNQVYPLRVVWDLDETLISSQRYGSKWRKEQANQILKRSGDEVEHVDDDSLHFVTTIRPRAREVLAFFRWLPGCEQHVSTAASAGYAANVMSLLDPDGSVFRSVVSRQPSAGKPLLDAVPEGTGLGRAVLVDNRPSCHSAQPGNGILVPDFIASKRALTLEGGPYAVGGVFNVHASDRARSARWPLEPRSLASGDTLGAGGVIAPNDGGATPSASGRPRRAATEAGARVPSRRRRTREERTARADDVDVDSQLLRHKLAVAAYPKVAKDGDDGEPLTRKALKQRQNAALDALVDRANRAGATALLVVDAKSSKAHRIPNDVDFPLISGGAKVAHTLANQHARNTDGKAAITTATLVAPDDDALVYVAAKLALCWLLPDVTLALTPVDPDAKRIRL